MPTISLDLDGVLRQHDGPYEPGPVTGPPVPGAYEVLHRLMDDFAVVVHTARSEWLAAQWVRDQLHVATTTGVPASGRWTERGKVLVTRLKLPCVAYVDDRAVPFTDSWGAVLAHPLIAPHLTAPLPAIPEEYRPPHPVERLLIAQVHDLEAHLAGLLKSTDPEEGPEPLAAKEALDRARELADTVRLHLADRRGTTDPEHHAVLLRLADVAEICYAEGVAALTRGALLQAAQWFRNGGMNLVRALTRPTSPLDAFDPGQPAWD